MTAAVETGFARLVEYPETDGKPMGETELHRDEMVDAIEALKRRYRSDPNIYVAGDLFFYYEEGNPAACLAPDVCVVLGVPKRKRRIYKLWEEGRAPSFVLEVTSRATRQEDRGNKRELCAELGVLEYFLYDPEADYLDPPLQGFRLGARRYEPIFADPKGTLESKALGLKLTLEAGRLRFIDAATGTPLPRLEEQEARAEQASQAKQEASRAKQEASRAKQEASRAKQEASRAKQEASRAKQEASHAMQRAEQALLQKQQAEQRAAETEAENARLRALLERK